MKPRRPSPSSLLLLRDMVQQAVLAEEEMHCACSLVYLRHQLDLLHFSSLSGWLMQSASAQSTFVSTLERKHLRAATRLFVAWKWHPFTWIVVVLADHPRRMMGIEGEFVRKRDCLQGAVDLAHPAAGEQVDGAD